MTSSTTWTRTPFGGPTKITHTRHQPTATISSAYYTVHPEDRQTFIDAIVPHLGTTAQQDGCVF